MKIHHLHSLGLALLISLPWVARAADPTPAASNPGETTAAAPASLSSAAADVVKLAQSGVSDDVLLAFVNSTQQPYNLSANGILYLKNAGLPSAVLEAMLKHDSTLARTPSPVPNPTSPASLQIISAGRPTNSVPATLPPQVQGEAVATREPPPIRIEAVPPPPTGYDYVWSPGYWVWRNGAWVWTRGTWIVRPRPGALWVSGFWLHKGHTWVWTPGHWR